MPLLASSNIVMMYKLGEIASETIITNEFRHENVSIVYKYFVYFCVFCQKFKS